MMIVRPCRFSDLPGIEKLVNESTARISTLPADREKLSEKIDRSSRSFLSDEAVAGQELYLFVMEDCDNREIIGTAGIEACAGNGAPFYNYRQDELIHSSQPLNVYKEVDILYMTHELTGATRLCSLSIAPRFRDTPWFDLLSRSRFMFMQLHQEKFNPRIIVEIQGVQDKQGASPFWESLGRHFFDMDFATADYYSGVKSKTFIAEMMPPHPIYVPLLTQEAQEVISRPHEGAEANCQFLCREGFRLSRYIDIFDGGPTLEAFQNDLVTSKSLHCKQVRLSEQRSGLKYLVSTTGMEDFRATLTHLTEGIGELIRLDYGAAEALGIKEDDNIACAGL